MPVVKFGESQKKKDENAVYGNKITTDHFGRPINIVGARNIRIQS